MNKVRIPKKVLNVKVKGKCSDRRQIKVGMSWERCHTEEGTWE
jgi:hypothetical protein